MSKKKRKCYVFISWKVYYRPWDLSGLLFQFFFDWKSGFFLLLLLCFIIQTLVVVEICSFFFRNVLVYVVRSFMVKSINGSSFTKSLDFFFVISLFNLATTTTTKTQTVAIEIKSFRCCWYCIMNINLKDMIHTLWKYYLFVSGIVLIDCFCFFFHSIFFLIFVFLFIFWLWHI